MYVCVHLYVCVQVRVWLYVYNASVNIHMQQTRVQRTRVQCAREKHTKSTKSMTKCPTIIFMSSTSSSLSISALLECLDSQRSLSSGYVRITDTLTMRPIAVHSRDGMRSHRLFQHACQRWASPSALRTSTISWQNSQKSAPSVYYAKSPHC